MLGRHHWERKKYFPAWQRSGKIAAGLKGRSLLAGDAGAEG